MNLQCPICQKPFNLSWRGTSPFRSFSAACIHESDHPTVMGCWLYGDEEGLLSYSINFEFDKITWGLDSDKTHQSTGLYLMNRFAHIERVLYELPEFTPLKDANFYYQMVQRFVNLKAFL